MKENDNSSLVEVFAGTQWEAEVVKGLLKTNGIEALLKDRSILGILAPYSSLNVSVMVSDTESESAVEIIKSLNEDKTAED